MPRGRPKKAAKTAEPKAKETPGFPEVVPAVPEIPEPAVAVIERDLERNPDPLPGGQVRVSVFDCPKGHRMKGPETKSAIPCEFCKAKGDRTEAVKTKTFNELWLDGGETIKPLPQKLAQSVVKTAIYWCGGPKKHANKGPSSKPIEKCGWCGGKIERTEVFDETWSDQRG